MAEQETSVTSEEEKSAVQVNYADRCTAELEETRLATQILCDENTPLLILGEGNLTMSLALAMERKSFENMYISKLEAGHWRRDWHTATHLQMLGRSTYTIKKLLRQVDEAHEDDQTPTNEELERELKSLTWTKLQETRAAVLKLRLPKIRRGEPVQEFPKVRSVDATSVQHVRDPIRSAVMSDRSAILFQCPWKPFHETGNTAQLVQDFLASAAQIQPRGTFLFIGIVNEYPYVKSYQLQSFIPNISNSAVLQNYTFCGADLGFPQILLSNGYVHEGIKDIHDDVVYRHVTLCFQKL